ncbi:MAG: hypothetical protein Q7T82_18125 [Armatimonadota bacterium]|nr:hypothetical protein [Armatimonadota bacterium]
MKLRLPFLIFVMTCLTAMASPQIQAKTTGGSRMYHTWLKGCMKDIRRDVPLITKSAESAARLYVEDEYKVGAWGDPGFVEEFRGRSGGILPISWWVKENATKSVVLMTLRDDRLSDDLRQASEFQKQGNMVVIFARKTVTKDLEPSATLSLIDTHAAEHGGLIPLGDKWLVPTDQPANIAALWTWTGEFIAACTRLGKAPQVWQSMMVPGATERNNKYIADMDQATPRGRLFLEKCPPPFPPGKAARAYLDGVTKNVDEVFSKEGATIRTVASTALQTRANGGGIYAALTGHSLMHEMGCAHDPGLFKPVANADIKPVDFVIGMGYDSILTGKFWKNVAETICPTGAKIAWSFTDYRPDAVKSLLPGEMYINQHWAMGDSLVTVPGYDVKILPPSGVIGDAIYWSINAEMLRPSDRGSGERR